MSAVPSTFGKYFLTEKIATGGMAEIYLAKILGPGGFEKFLVIKKIHPALSGERQFVEMFVAEAKTLVSLTHGNIVPIYELGMVDSTYFIAMEYIDGPTLEQLLAALHESGESLSPAMTAYICAELLKGLDYAHRKGEGVIHRDLSPRNVMLSREGEVKLVDFGIAVAQVEHATAVGSTRDPAGSYPYMSPEQVRGDTLDARSDLFATGILLWEMLTGRHLFARLTDQETLDAVLSAEIPEASKFCREAAGVLDVLCARALQRSADERYGSAGEFLIAVNRFLYSQIETVTPQDVSRFIARHCPPTLREFARPATLGSQSEASSRHGTVPMAPESRRPPRKRSGTVPMERPQGKKRAETVQSFATHVNLREVLSHVGSSDDLEDTRTDSQSNEPGLLQKDSKPSPSERSLSPAFHEQRTHSVVASRLLPLAGGAALLAAAILVFVGRSSGGNSTSAASANFGADIVAPMDAAITVVADAPPLALPASERDARRIGPRPARKDAAPAVPRRRPDAQPKKAMGSIRVGANPWAEVFLDGKSIGRAPGNFEVSAGPHALELRFRDQSKSMQIEVKPLQLTSVGVVDFTIK